MSNVPLKNIVDSVFRSNPGYQLVLFDRLPAEQQEVFRDLTGDPEFYGVLIPQAGGRNTKSVCRETALLLFVLNTPGPLPMYVRNVFGASCNQAIAELVLDEVLEIERDGTFVCGSEAYELIYDQREARETKETLSRLTEAALKYGQSLDIDDSGMISARLYFYNRLPISAYWMDRFPGQDAVAAWLGIENGGAVRRSLEGRWTRLKPSSEFEGWYQWQSLQESDSTSQSGGRARQIYKLYVSPKPEHVRDAFQAFAEGLTDSGAHHFKVGWDVAGLLRPDKMVAYFWNFRALEEAANKIGTRLAGCPAHGVPFTAALQEDGLLSWGIDPLPEKGTLAWQERPSWRLWVTNRLANALVAAKRNGSDGIEPWRFALERLRLENIDTDTWTPLEHSGGAEARV